MLKPLSSCAKEIVGLLINYFEEERGGLLVPFTALKEGACYCYTNYEKYLSFMSKIVGYI